MHKVKTCLKKILIDKQTLERREIMSRIDNPCKLNLEEHFALMPTKSVELSPNFYNEIEFWNNVFPRINTCKLKGGEYFLKTLLQNPISCVEELEKRKNMLINFENVYENDEINLSDLESNVLWHFEKIDENIGDLYDMVYFKFYLLRGLNKNAESLSALNFYRILLSPLVGILSPIIYFLVPYLIIKRKFGLDISFWSYLKLMYNMMMNSSGMFLGTSKTVQTVSYMFSLVFYFTGLFNSFEISRTLYKISKFLTEKINNFTDFIQKASSFASKYWNESMGEIFGVAGLSSAEEEVAYANKLVNVPFSLFSNFGRQLLIFKNINKTIVKSILYKTYVLDAMISLINFKKQFEFTFATFIEDKNPVISLNNLKHPGLTECVPNNLKIGKNVPNNIIITGCNAGGKSVTIKSILINALLSQTCCISCCENSVMTPFKRIYAQINVPDMTGHESLFEAEMHRCKKNLDMLAAAEQPDKSLIVMDEIFSSTNPLEAICGAYAVCKKMSTYQNNILIFTTHLNYLTTLKKTKQFLNYKMDTVVNGEDIKFTYKLVPGVNKHFLALELLKKNGFDKDLIEEALELKKKFV